jgi:hypothetical protein
LKLTLIFKKKFTGLVLENRLHVESAQAIISSHKVPLDIAHSLGLTAHASTVMQHQNFSQSQSASPLNMNYQKHQPQSQPFEHKSNIHHFHGINFGTMAQTSAPNTCSSLNTSPMHQITRGISGLTTNPSNEPLDLTMEASGGSGGGCDDMDSNQQWYDMRPLNLSTTCSSSPSTSAQAQQQQQQQQRMMMQATPPTSPSNNLCIIQEEHLPASSSHHYCIDINAPHHHPQISLTDVQGSEITLVALSDSSSRDSDDSLDTNNSNETRRTISSCVTTPSGSTKGGISMFHEFLIKEPSHDMPSITRGVGRKASLENEYSKHQHQQSSSVNPASVKIVEAEQYARRGSDKSLGFSDDSLSNDSNQSPAQEVSHSSGFKSTEEERLSPDSLSESRGGSSDEYYELPLNECQNLDASSIIEIVRKQIINSKIPPNRINQGGEDVTEDTNLSLEYSSGLQIELKICERQKSGVEKAAIAAAAVASTSSGGGGGENTSKGIIKLRRISGDSTEYGKLCQQLLTQLTV